MGLRYLPHPKLPTYASGGAALKALDLRAYLERIAEGLEAAGLAVPRVKLFVLNEADWRERLRLPYGFPAAKKGEVYLPATLPERLHHRLLAAFAAHGVRPPIPLAEALDLVAGHEYGHAVALALGKRRRRWAENERLAHLLWLTGLWGDPRLERVRRWAKALARLPAPSGRPRSLAEELAAQGRMILETLEDLETMGPERLLKQALH